MQILVKDLNVRSTRSNDESISLRIARVTTRERSDRDSRQQRVCVIVSAQLGHDYVNVHEVTSDGFHTTVKCPTRATAPINTHWSRRRLLQI